MLEDVRSQRGDAAKHDRSFQVRRHDIFAAPGDFEFRRSEIDGLVECDRFVPAARTLKIHFDFNWALEAGFGRPADLIEAGVTPKSRSQGQHRRSVGARV